MTRSRLDDAIEAAIAALSAVRDDALSKAQAEGFPDRNDAIAWCERAKSAVLHVRDRSLLRSELPYLAERGVALLRQVNLPNGLTAELAIQRFLARLPAIRALLAEDVEAAFDGDPAAKSFAEIVASYPSIDAVATHRLAHELYRMGVPLLPRIMSEHAHAHTGIDIHPGAEIGRRFFIDHGTGVVIGETTKIGDRVRIYQGVTLGARSPRHGESFRGVKRHPTLEDDVTIYAGTTILGGETVIGSGSVIGGNVWLTESVPPGSKVVAEPPRLNVRRRTGGAEDPQLHWEI